MTFHVYSWSFLSKRYLNDSFTLKQTRKTEIRPGFTSFPTGRSHDIELGTINVENLR